MVNTAQILSDWLDQRNRSEPWQKHFAWLPVVTVSGNRVWLKKIFKRKQYLRAIAIDNEAYYWQYADCFEVLKLV